MRSIEQEEQKSNRSGKTERLEARVTAKQKALLQRAADLEGRSLTDFVLSSAQDTAKRVIHEHELLHLTANDTKVFVDALLSPPAPNENFRKAARRYNQKHG